MSTTSLKLSGKAKRAVATAARQQRVSPHAFMVQAIENEAARAAKQESFHQDALLADAETQASGLSIPADAVHEWLKAVAAGRSKRRPVARPWRK